MGHHTSLTSLKPAKFSDRVLAWFQRHGRKDLPWQKDPTPYRVWVSEIMLQQTRVSVVIPYYQRLMESFPEINALADGSLDQVLYLWSGLGYYARARNLHAAAQQIQTKYNGVFPVDFEKVVALPGIGRSTAGAILALAQNRRYAILDGNVKRLLARFQAVEGWPGQSSVANQLWELAEGYTPDEQVAEYTQAMMDLGATVCSRSQPQCDHCPLAADCRAHALGREKEFPVPKPRKSLPVRYTTMVMVCNGQGEVLLEHRPPTGIWGGLWSFPEVRNPAQILSWCEQAVGERAKDTEQWSVVRHTFSHFHLDITPVFVWIKNPSVSVSGSDQSIWVKLHGSDQRGFPAPVQRLLRRLQERLD